MGNAVTVAAFGKLFMYHGAVRFAVTALAFRQMAMLRMALGAGKSRMLCLMILQQLVGLLMATGTDFLGLVNRVGYLERCMNGMTGQAVRGFQCCHGAVIFMAFGTYRDTAMFL